MRSEVALKAGNLFPAKLFVSQEQLSSTEVVYCQCQEEEMGAEFGMLMIISILFTVNNMRKTSPFSHFQHYASDAISGKLH